MVEQMNTYARRGIPFLFIIDFEAKQPVVVPLAEAAAQGIFYDFGSKANFVPQPLEKREIVLKKSPLPFADYKRGFEIVQQHLRAGNSFLVNLTFPTQIAINLSLPEIFQRSRARYKLLYKDQFVVFSPEIFVRIQDGRICSYPMKGTIDARLPEAAEQLMNDPKEKAEHFTIVDLIRNDLSSVAEQVRVEHFRYLEQLHTSDKDLLQASSKISGLLPKGYQNNIGDILGKLLPAGSISGAPKAKTVDIIREAEGYERGYYTGVFGYYDRGYLESAVMIRFIEQQGEETYFKSGGGITIYSDPWKEYQELIDKVYVPITGND